MCFSVKLPPVSNGLFGVPFRGLAKLYSRSLSPIGHSQTPPLAASHISPKQFPEDP